jgi:branched-chain amino acid transport system substrate-binding protein
MKTTIIKMCAMLAVIAMPGLAMAEEVCGGTMADATGEPIRIGAIVGATGPADFSSSSKSAAAFFDCVNAHGGINGRPVEYLVEDDGWNPENAANAAAKLVTDQGVVAMAGSTSYVECGTNAAFYEANSIGVIAGVGVPRECFFSKNIAPTNMGPRLSTLAALIAVHESAGAKNVVCMAPNIPNVGGWVCDGLAAWGAANGVTVTPVLHDPATLDPTSLILQAMAISPDAIIMSEPGPAAVAILQAAEEQGLGDMTIWAGPTSLYDTAFPAAVGAYWDGKVPTHIEFNELTSTGADNQAWVRIMDTYSDASAPRDSFSQSGYLSAKFMTEVLRGIQGDITPASVLAALQGMQPVASDLLCTPWAFGPGARHNSNATGRMVNIAGEGWALARDCFATPDPELSDLQ